MTQPKTVEFNVAEADARTFAQQLDAHRRMAIASNLPSSEADAAEQLITYLRHQEVLVAVLETVQPVLPNSVMLQAIVRRLAGSLRASALAVDTALQLGPTPDPAQC